MGIKINLPNSSLEAISIMAKKPIKKIKIVESAKVILSLSEASQRSYKDLMNIHYEILGEYQKFGPSRDYTHTNYYKKYSIRKNPWPHNRIVHRINSFFNLYEKIKVEGLQETSDPLCVIDLRNFNFIPCKPSFILNGDKNRCIEFYRWNGSHRCAIAKILNINEIPVVLTKIKINE